MSTSSSLFGGQVPETLPWNTILSIKRSGRNVSKAPLQRGRIAWFKVDGHLTDYYYDEGSQLWRRVVPRGPRTICMPLSSEVTASSPPPFWCVEDEQVAV